MTPKIKKVSNKKIIGKSLKMSLSNNKTVELWQSFMEKRHLIKKPVGTDLYSLQVYDESLDFKSFNPKTEFVKWAAVEVKGFETVPDIMEEFVLEGGLYAVFIHKGLASDFQKTFQYIFGQWLPNLEYELDKRPHFEVLGERYKNNDPSSEEEVWIPIKRL